MALAATSKKWLIGVAAIVLAVLAVVVLAIVTGGDDGDDGDADVAAGTTTTTGPSDEPSTTTAPPADTATTVPSTTTGGGFAAPEDVAAARYGSDYIGTCESVPWDGEWDENALCSIRIALSDTEAVLFVGPPYSEVIEDLELRLDGDRWTLVDTYAVGELGVDDPTCPTGWAELARSRTASRAGADVTRDRGNGGQLPSRR